MSKLNRTKIITIVCWSISALALVGLLIWVLLGFGGRGGWSFGFETGAFEPMGTHAVPAEEIDSLFVDWISGAVSIRVHAGDEIEITEFARRSLRDNEEMLFNIDGGTLRIYFAERRMFQTNMPSKQLEILIPYALSENFANFQVNTVSGRIEVSDISANAVSLRTTSGRIMISDIEADEIHLHTVSGRIETENTMTADLQAQTTSGRHELSGDFQRVNARSTSGRIEVRSTTVPESLTARTTSGRIEVTVPNEEAVSVQYSMSSGRFSSEIPVLSHAGADAQFHLTTTSGRISIFALR